MAQKTTTPASRPTPMSTQGDPNPPKSDATPVPTKPSTAYGSKESTIPSNANPKG
jgi:hypothetical protein